MTSLLRSFDYECSPRGQPVRELTAASFTLTNPRNRLIHSPARAVNYGFGVGELCWYLRGDSDLETLVYYNKRAPQFSDDGKTVNSDYGRRLFGWRAVGGVYKSQWEICRDELLRDPDSRRAVMHVNDVDDIFALGTAGTKDFPCTMSLQLMIRGGRLHMQTNMRSGDVSWGMPYDVFSFTVMQELFMLELKELGAPIDDIGSYHHSCGSLHLYGYHYDTAERVALEDVETPPMDPLVRSEVDDIVNKHEPAIRLDGSEYCTWGAPLTGAAGWMHSMLWMHRHKRMRQERDERARDKTAV